MLFGYIKDYTVKYLYRDFETDKVFISFNSLEKKDKWLSNFDDETLDIIENQFKFEVIKVPWYENNFELVKLIFPFFILHQFIGFFAFLLFGLVFWIYYFLYRCKNQKN